MNPSNLFNVPDGWYGTGHENRDGPCVVAIRNKYCEAWAKNESVIQNLFDLPYSFDSLSITGICLHPCRSPTGSFAGEKGWAPALFNQLGKLTWLAPLEGLKNEWLEKYEVE